MTQKILYFICTGNSARSQMAEGFAKEYLDINEWEVRSAGVEQHGLNPLATEAMAEVGIDISKQASDLIDRNLMGNATLVVTLCGDARDRCPVTPPEVQKEHWGFEDPAAVEGTKDEKMAGFRRVRDQIDTRMKEFAAIQNEVKK